MLDLVILLTICAVYLLLAALVLTNDSRRMLNRILAGLLAVTPMWCSVVYFEDAETLHHHIDLLVRLDYSLATVMLGLFYWFSTTLAGKKRPILTRVVVGVAGMLIVLSLGGFVATGRIVAGDVVQEPQSLGFGLFIGYLILTLAIGGLELIIRSLSAHGRERAQIFFVTTGLAISVIALTMTLVVAPRLYDISTPAITRLGLYSTLFFAIFSSYALVRHQFLDIRQTAARSVAYILSVGALACLYVGVVFIVIRLSLGGQAVNQAQLGVFTVAAIGLALSYSRLRYIFDWITDAIFYRRGYSSHEVIEQVGDVTASTVDVQRVVHRVMGIVEDALKPTFIAVVTSPHGADKMTHLFSRQRLSGHYRELPPREQVVNDIIFLHQLSEKDRLVPYLRDRKINALLKLETSHQLLGYMVIGNRQSGGYYNLRDSQLLSTIGDELALAMENSLRFQEIQAFNKTLQAKVLHATQELRQTNRKLRKIDATKDEFISMTSHQLRTPLTSIKGYISMMLEGDLGSLKPAQRRALEEAYSSSQRMVYLIADFLNLSRLQTGRFELEYTDVSLADLISEEIAQLQASARSRGVKVRYLPHRNFPLMRLDENKIRQVMMNFIDNAIYYAKPEGGTVTVELADHPHHVSFRVVDNGIGVPDNERDQLFGKFFRAANAKKARPDGTGIGLFMAKKVIDAHGGKIIFETKYGEGSVFGFRLPKQNHPS